MSNRRNLLESYLLPLLLSLLILILSVAIGFVQFSNLLVATAIVAVIGVSVFLAVFIVSNVNRKAERQDTYGVITNLLLAGERESGSKYLSEEEVLAIEAFSEEVWVLAYDLGWEGANSSFTSMVIENLAKEVKYRYLVPDNPSVQLRVNNLLQIFGKSAKNKALPRFRKTKRDTRLVQFGITIYNPSVMTGGERTENDTVVVFFPHYSAFGPTGSSRFLTMKGASTIEIQEGFLEVWNEASDVITIPTE